MSDAQMDKVTAAGIAHHYAFGQHADKGWQAMGFVGNAPNAPGHTK